eukprot:GSMAST32.ASY1.ANO1.2549.1 assembled CDS
MSATSPRHAAAKSAARRLGTVEKNILKKNKNEVSNDDETDHVKVFIRVRPLLGREINSKACTTVLSSNEIRVVDAEQTFECNFDHIFRPTETQDVIYKSVERAVHHVVSGYNSSIFAYGQTGSGKTYTLFGKENMNILNTYEPMRGIIPRCCQGLFKHLNQKQINSKKNVEKKDEKNIYCSFMQIYNEKIFDLLRDSSMSSSLELHENITVCFHVFMIFFFFFFFFLWEIFSLKIFEIFF